MENYNYNVINIINIIFYITPELSLPFYFWEPSSICNLNKQTSCTDIWLVIYKCKTMNLFKVALKQSWNKASVYWTFFVVDVAFQTYKLESYIGSQVSMKCLAQSANSIKTILIQKIESPVNHTVAKITPPDMTSHVDGATVSYANKCLTLAFSSLTWSDDVDITGVLS